MTNSTLGRVQVIQGTPPALPGKCALCGTTEGPVIDFGFELDFYGVVYFCVNNCLVEVANAMFYLSPEQHRELLDELLEANTEIGNLEEQNEELKSALRINFGRLAAIFNPPVAGSDVTPENDDEDESGSSEQVNEQGSSDVLDDDDAEETGKSDRIFTI